MPANAHYGVTAVRGFLKTRWDINLMVVNDGTKREKE